MVMLVMPIAIMATIVMANVNLSTAKRGIQINSINNSSVTLDLYEPDLPFRHYHNFYDFVIVKPFLQCKNAVS